MVSDHQIRMDTGGIPQHCGPPDDKKKLLCVPIAVGVTLHLGGYGGGRVERVGGVHHLYSEYGRAIHCDTPKSGNIHGRRSEDKVTGIKTVVGTGRDKLHRVAGGGGS